MCDLICDVITCCVLSCDTGKVNVSDEIMFENHKKRKYGNKRYFIHKYSTERSYLDIEFTPCYSDLIPERALTSLTVYDAYRQFAGQA